MNITDRDDGPNYALAQDEEEREFGGQALVSDEGPTAPDTDEYLAMEQEEHKAQRRMFALQMAAGTTGKKASPKDVVDAATRYLQFIEG